MAPTEGGLETGGTACLQQFLLVNIKKSHNCCVPFYNATSKKNKNLRFHRFPKKKGLKDQWIAKIRRDEGDYFAVTENTRRVCSKQFCEEDYTVSEDGKGKKIVLKKGAVPTIFKWSSEKRSRSTFVSKGKRKGESLEAPRKKRQVFLQLFNFIVSRCKDVKYWRSGVNPDENHQHEPDQLRQGRPRSLSMLDEYFPTLVRLRLRSQRGI